MMLLTRTSLLPQGRGIVLKKKNLRKALVAPSFFYSVALKRLKFLGKHLAIYHLARLVK